MAGRKYTAAVTSSSAITTVTPAEPRWRDADHLHVFLHVPPTPALIARVGSMDDRRSAYKLGMAWTRCVVDRLAPDSDVDGMGG